MQRSAFLEGIRTVHATEQADISYDDDIPRVYINLERDIGGLTIRLGSKIDDADVDQIVTWLKSTG